MSSKVIKSKFFKVGDLLQVTKQPLYGWPIPTERGIGDFVKHLVYILVIEDENTDINFAAKYSDHSDLSHISKIVHHDPKTFSMFVGLVNGRKWVFTRGDRLGVMDFRKYVRLVRKAKPNE